MNKKYTIPFLISIPLFVIGFALSLAGVYALGDIMLYSGYGAQAAAVITMAVVILAVYRHNKNYPKNPIKIFDQVLSYSLLTTAISLFLLSDSLHSMKVGYENNSDKIFDIVVLVILAICVIVSWTTYVIRIVALKKVNKQAKANLMPKEENDVPVIEIEDKNN